MNYSEIEDIFCLSLDKKYKCFLKKAAELEQVYGLKRKNEWVTIMDEDGNIAMPIWPSWEFAKYCQENQWKETAIESIDVFEFLEYWLQGMKKDGCRVLVFGDTGGGGISIDAEKLKSDLQDYLSSNM
jgi:hypothetical protein